MRRSWLLASLLLALLVAAPAPASAITTEEVVAALAAGQSEEEVLTLIKQSPTPFWLMGQAKSMLENSGVPDNIIWKMETKDHDLKEHIKDLAKRISADDNPAARDEVLAMIPNRGSKSFSVYAVDRIINAILAGDVFAFADYADATELHRKLFKKTPTYKHMLDGLSILKGELPNTAFHIDMSNKIGNYDVDSRSFYVHFANYGSKEPTESGFRFTEIASSLPKKSSTRMCYLRIQIKEEEAIKIEPIGERLTVRIYFSPVKISKIDSYHLNRSSLIDTDVIRIAVIDDYSNKELYSKSY